MIKRVLILFFVLTIWVDLCYAAKYTPPVNNRDTINFNTGWKYYKGTPSGDPESPSYNDGSWEDVSVPHTLEHVSLFLNGSTEDGTQPTMHRLIGWYRRHFSVDQSYSSRKWYSD